jgi:large conductance mechanosensitive channel
MKKFINEFKEFIAQGNVIDMAVAVVIGAAFKDIVNSLVNSVVMPLISLLLNGINVADWKWVIKPAVLDAAGNVVTQETALGYGMFIQEILEFFIIAICIFVMLKVVLSFKDGFMKLAKKEELEAAEEAAEEAPAESTEDILKDIRELLKAEK